MDTDDETERKELERDMEEWSVKSKPKLIGSYGCFCVDRYFQIRGVYSSVKIM